MRQKNFTKFGKKQHTIRYGKYTRKNSKKKMEKFGIEKLIN